MVSVHAGPVLFLASQLIAPVAGDVVRADVSATVARVALAALADAAVAFRAPYKTLPSHQFPFLDCPFPI